MSGLVIATEISEVVQWPTGANGPISISGKPDIIQKALRAPQSPTPSPQLLQEFAPTSGTDTPPSLPISPDDQRVAAAYQALVNAKVWTAHVAMHLSDQVRNRLFAQLDRLHDVDDWEDGDLPAQQASFVSFLRAMLALKPAKWPSLGLSHEGNLLAAWGAPGDRLALEFLAHDQMKWTLSHLRSDGQTVRNAGHGPSLEIGNLLAPYQPAHWFENADPETSR